MQIQAVATRISSLRPRTKHTVVWHRRSHYPFLPTAPSSARSYTAPHMPPPCFSRHGLPCRSILFSDRKTGCAASALACVFRYSAAGTLRQRNRKQLAAACDSVIPFSGFRRRLYAGQRTSYGLYNRASSRMPGYTSRLPGLSARGPDQRGARPLVWTLPDAARRGGIA
jgi:hypothetical protein